MSVWTEGVANMNAADLDTFGQPVVYTTKAVTITGILDISDAARGAGADAVSGRLWIREADLVTIPAKNDLITIGAYVYRVISEPEDERDGAGGMWLSLRRRAPAAVIIYYVDPVNGSDLNNGLSAGAAWQTTAQADVVSLTAGQSVLYRYGGEWLLYRKLGITMDEILLPMDLITYSLDTV